MEFGFNFLKKGKGEGIEKDSVLQISPWNRHFYLLQNGLFTHSYIWKMTAENTEYIFLCLRAFVATWSDSRMTATDEKRYDYQAA